MDTVNLETAIEKTASSKRVRMNVSITAKGFAQWEVTSEFETAEEAAAQLSIGIDRVRQVIKDKGLPEAGTD